MEAHLLNHTVVSKAGGAQQSAKAQFIFALIQSKPTTREPQIPSAQTTSTLSIILLIHATEGWPMLPKPMWKQMAVTSLGFNAICCWWGKNLDCLSHKCKTWEVQPTSQCFLTVLPTKPAMLRRNTCFLFTGLTPQ